jgi:hypothetical protein
MKRRSPPRVKPDKQSTQDNAVALAIAALTFIAQDPDRLGRFLALSGIGPESLRAAAREPGFLLGLLDHVSGDETLLLAFAADRGMDPTAVGTARAMLATNDPESPDPAC